MGIDLNIVQLLIRARQNGVAFDRMATLGRQHLTTDRSGVISILRRAGYNLSADGESKLLDPAAWFAEEFFKVLGAKEITSIDASDYEGAQIVHDMNRPIPDELASSFDVVLDGGTLEHIFNFPIAGRNCMQMVRVGGRFISCTAGNNFCGHGFYQFSPELFYGLLSRANGFDIESCIAWEDVQGSRFYQVPDPETLGSRIELASRARTYLFVQAKRIGDPLPDYVPIQSDWVRCWNASGVQGSQTSDSSGLRAALKRIKPLRSAVLFARGLPVFRRFRADAENRRRRLDRNLSRFLVPLEGTRVRL